MHNEQSIGTPIEVPLSTQQSLWWTMVGYGAMLFIGIGSVYLILRYGATLAAPPPLSGVISPTLFAMMVLMALVTTIMTTPLVDWLLPKPLK